MQSVAGSSDPVVPSPHQQQKQQQQQSMLQLSFSFAQCAAKEQLSTSSIRSSCELQDEDRMICSSSDVRCSVDNPQTCRVDAALAVRRCDYGCSVKCSAC
jgi:hypothetical protein